MTYPTFPWDRYLSYSEMLEAWLDLERLFPGKITHEILGQTYLGKNILLFKIGNPDGGKLWWNATTHGGEIIGTEVYYRYARWLLENKEPGISDNIMRVNYTLICPFTNVDGYPSIAPLPFQSEGSRNNKNPTGTVNLNRNFPATWRTDLGHYNPIVGHWTGEPTDVNGQCTIVPYTYKSGYNALWWCYKASVPQGMDVPSHWEYRGSNPGSEKETQVILSGLAKWCPKFLLDFHIWNPPTLFRSPLSDITYCNTVIAKYKALATQRGVTAFPFSTTGIAGPLSDSGRSIGATSFLLEAVDANKDVNGKSLYDQLGIYTQVNAVFPKFLPLAITLSNECAAPPPINGKIAGLALLTIFGLAALGLIIRGDKYGKSSNSRT